MSITKTYTVTITDVIIEERLAQARFMADVARTNILMFKATGDKKYEEQAKKDIQKGKDILNGFMRPLGAVA